MPFRSHWKLEIDEGDDGPQVYGRLMAKRFGVEGQLITIAMSEDDRHRWQEAIEDAAWDATHPDVPSAADVIHPGQLEVLAWFEDSQDALYDEILQRARAHWTRLGRSPRGLAPLTEVQVSLPDGSGRCLLGLSGPGGTDEEHGVGIVCRLEEVVDVGDQTKGWVLYS